MPQELLTKAILVLKLLLGAADAQHQTTHDQIAAAIADLERARLEIVVPPGANLQAVIASAPPGATLHLAPGAVYTGNFVCRAALRLTSDVAFGEDERTTPGHKGLLAALASATNQPALTIADGSDGCMVDGVEFVAKGPSTNALAVGTTKETTLEQYPRNVTLKNILILGDEVVGLARCTILEGINVSLINSHIAGCRSKDKDSQAVWINCGPGPYRIVNNYLEAAAENLLFAGDRCLRPGGVAENVTIEGNTFAKPMAWRTASGWSVKNLLEIKSARKVTIRGNVFDGNWPDGQAGCAIVFTPRNQYGPDTWATIEDVVFEHNIIRNVACGLSLLGDDNYQPSQRMTRIAFRHNTWLISKLMTGPNPSRIPTGYCAEIGRAPQFLTFENETFINDGAHCFYTYESGPVVASQGSVFRNVIMLHQKYTAFDGSCKEKLADGTLDPITPKGCTGAPYGPTAALAKFYPGAIWEGIVIGGGRTSDYPPGTAIMPLADFKAAFSDYAGGVVDAAGALAGKGAAIDPRRPSPAAARP